MVSRLSTPSARPVRFFVCLFQCSSTTLGTVSLSLPLSLPLPRYISSSSALGPRFDHDGDFFLFLAPPRGMILLASFSISPR
jgi:hypothetical protein